MPLQEAKRYCREVVRVLKELKETRDMSVSEIKLTLAIEDASVREQKEYMGIEVRCNCTPVIKAEATLQPLAAVGMPMQPRCSFRPNRLDDILWWECRMREEHREMRWLQRWWTSQMGVCQRTVLHCGSSTKR